MQYLAADASWPYVVAVAIVSVFGWLTTRAKRSSDKDTTPKDAAEVQANWQALAAMTHEQLSDLYGEVATLRNRVVTLNGDLTNVRGELEHVRSELIVVQGKYRESLIVIRHYRYRHPDTEVEIGPELLEDL